MAADPNMKCVCGYRKFRQTVRTVDERVERWVNFVSDDVGSGFGSVPFGTAFGAGAGMWGLFEIDIQRPKRFINCESCGRTRSATATGGFGVLGGYLVGETVYAVTTDVSILTCIRIRFTRGSEIHTVEVAPYLGLPLPVAMDASPITTSESIPTGVLAGVIQATVPSGDDGLSGEYVVSLVDVCLGTEVELFTAVFATLLDDGLLMEDGDSLLDEDGEELLLG